MGAAALAPALSAESVRWLVLLPPWLAVNAALGANLAGLESGAVATKRLAALIAELTVVATTVA